jgi:APAF-1 helical domain
MRKLSMTSLVTPRLTDISFIRDIERLTDGFVGRDWIFQYIDNWLENTSDRFFLLTGEAGMGKSAIASQLTKIRDYIKAYHFCQKGHAKTLRCSNIIRFLAAQLVKNLPNYGQALASSIKPVQLRVEVNIPIDLMSKSQITKIYIENLKESDPENELEILIRVPLLKLEEIYTCTQQKPPDVVILIDSINEAMGAWDETMVSLLAKLSCLKLPKWVRFILISCPQAQLFKYFEGINPYNMGKISPENLTDIWQYIEKQLDDPDLQEVLQQAEVASGALCAKIAKLAKVNFLYVKLLVNDIKAKRQSLNDLSVLPATIDEIYYNFFKQLPMNEWVDEYQPILGKLAVTQEPLTQKQLEKFTGIKADKVRQCLEMMCQFLHVQRNEEGHKAYGLFHESLRDYLLDKERNISFYCDAKQQHNLIIQHYKKNSQWEEIDWTKADKYGLLHLAKHLDAAGREEELYTLLTETLNWVEAKFTVLSSNAPYIDDLELAISKFSDPLEPNELRILVKLYTALRLGIPIN